MSDYRLVRSDSDRILAGVCSGIAAYLNIDPTFVRLIFLLLVPAGGLGISLYLGLLILLPTRSSVGQTAAAIVRENLTTLSDGLHLALRRLGESFEARPVATAVIIVGAYLLVRNVTGFALDLRLVAPLLLVGLGIYVIFGRR